MSTPVLLHRVQIPEIHFIRHLVLAATNYFRKRPASFFIITEGKEIGSPKTRRDTHEA